MKHLRYAKYILKHRWYVFVECLKLGIPIRGLLHDISKLLPSEWFPYADYFYGYKFPDKQWHGDMRHQIRWEWTESGINHAFDMAWLKHQRRNKHHWQYWLLTMDIGVTIPMPMPHKYVLEMVADWNGAGKAITGVVETKSWYLKNKENMQLHSSTKIIVESLLGLDVVSQA